MSVSCEGCIRGLNNQLGHTCLMDEDNDDDIVLWEEHKGETDEDFLKALDDYEVNQTYKDVPRPPYGKGKSAKAIRLLHQPNEVIVLCTPPPTLELGFSVTNDAKEEDIKSVSSRSEDNEDDYRDSDRDFIADSQEDPQELINTAAALRVLKDTIIRKPAILSKVSKTKRKGRSVTEEELLAENKILKKQIRELEKFKLKVAGALSNYELLNNQ